MTKTLVFIAVLIIFTGCNDKDKAVLSTGEVTFVTHKSATVSGYITGEGDAPLTERGFVWDIQPAPHIKLLTKITAPFAATGPFQLSITGLASNTIYYVRAYAINSAGVSYGNEVRFSTSPDAGPIMETIEGTDTRFTSAVIGGRIISPGTSEITEKGIVYSEKPQPTIRNITVKDSSEASSFAITLTGLTTNTKYYARAYAQNDVALNYGNEISFTTSSYVLPTVQTSDPFKIEIDRAAITADAKSAGTLPVIEKGIVYAQAEHPTTVNSKIGCGSGTGPCTAQLNGLVENTLYFARAYAISDAGTSYGEEVSFRTKVSALPASYLYDWFDISGKHVYAIAGNQEIILWDSHISYLYGGPSSITAVEGGYNVIGTRIGWWNDPVTFYLRQGSDHNAITIGSSKSATKSLWHVVGRTVRIVKFGTGLAKFQQTGETTTWTETNDKGELTSWSYTETSRTDWSVYLTRNDGAIFRIDIHAKAIYFAATPAAAMTKLYDLTAWNNS
jgi:hypothetical protein